MKYWIQLLLAISILSGCSGAIEKSETDENSSPYTSMSQNLDQTEEESEDSEELDASSELEEESPITE